MNVDVGVAVTHQYKQGVERDASVTNIGCREGAREHSARIRLRRREQVDNDRCGRVRIAGRVNVQTRGCAGESLEGNRIRNRRTGNGKHRATIASCRVGRWTLVRTIHRRGHEAQRSDCDCPGHARAMDRADVRVGAGGGKGT